MQRVAPEVENASTYAEVDALVARCLAGEDEATEALLARFRPLLRSRMQAVWATLQGDMSGIEWSDVENQLTLIFLTRLRLFRPDDGVYFSHYIGRMLDLDARAWRRELHRGAALPFSQIHSDADEDDWQSDDADSYVSEEGEADHTGDIEQLMSLREALATLTTAQREVVWQCCVRARTESEVAAELGLSRSAIRNRLDGALAKLRKHFASIEDEPYFLNIPTAATRTGRVSSVTEREAWRHERNLMARNEQRPDLVGVGAGRPVLLRGIFDFPATGLKTPELLSTKLRYVVPPGRVLGIRYVRAGVSCEKMVCLATVVNGDIHRLVPVAPNSAMHVPFAIVEPLPAGSEVEIHIGCDAAGTAIVDVGFLEMPA